MQESFSRLEIEPKVYHVRMYTIDQHGYSSSFQVFVDGSMGVIYGLNGEDFMRHVHKHIKELYEKTGVTRMFFHMMEPTLRLLKFSLRGICEFEEIERITKNDRELIFVNMYLKK